MNITRGVVEGFREIISHRFRSFLTVLGIILGVASLLAMFGLTNGIAVGMRKSLQTFGGAERIGIIPSDVPPEQESIKEISPGRTYNDVVALRRMGTTLSTVAPEKRMNGVSLTYKNKRFDTDVRGVEKESFPIGSLNLAEGRIITDLDQDQKNRVVVLGLEAKNKLFGEKGISPLGENIKINGIGFRVVGVLEPWSSDWLNNRAYIPLSTCFELFYGAKVENGVDSGPDPLLDALIVKVRDFSQVNSSIEQMRNILNLTHRGIQDFGFDTREDWAEQVEDAVRGARLSGMLIACVSLLAGGVGITNIMLASIKERTREIGVRRALGARPFDIFFQITLEALLLAVLGGMLGLLVGLGLIEILKNIATNGQPPILDLASIMFSFGSGVAVGFMAGLFPAWRASQLSPILALRYE